MWRIMFFSMALLWAFPAAASSDEFPYGSRIEFAAFRNGQQIGTHRVVFERHGDRLAITTSIELAVKVIGLTAYRYTHRSRETWIGNSPMSFESSTDDDGKTYAIWARWDAQTLLVTRATPGGSGTAQAVMPAALLPSTHWNMKQTRQGSLLNAQKGTQDEIAVKPLRRVSVDTFSGKIDAMHYRYEGGVRMDQWFDDRGRWVKMRFAVSDGSTIDYVLQE